MDNVDRGEQATRLLLSQPLPKIADVTVTVKCLVPFRAGSPIRGLEVGETVEIPRTLAMSLQAIGRAEILSSET